MPAWISGAEKSGARTGRRRARLDRIPSPSALVPDGTDPPGSAPVSPLGGVGEPGVI